MREEHRVHEGATALHTARPHTASYPHSPPHGLTTLAWKLWRGARASAAALRRWYCGGCCVSLAGSIRVISASACLRTIDPLRSWVASTVIRPADCSSNLRRESLHKFATNCNDSPLLNSLLGLLYPILSIARCLHPPPAGVGLEPRAVPRVVQRVPVPEDPGAGRGTGARAQGEGDDGVDRAGRGGGGSR